MSEAPLQLRACWRDGRVESAEAVNARPLAAALLRGKSPEEAAAVASALFSLCGVAQRHAVRAACGAARGETFPLDVATERELVIESARLHLWRILLDWPMLFDVAPVRERFGGLYRDLGRVRSDRDAFDMGGQLLNLVGSEWLGGFFSIPREPRNLTEFMSVCGRGGRIGGVLARLIEAGASDPMEDPVPVLPSMGAEDLARAVPGGWPDAAFCRAPHLHGKVCETGPLARQVGHPLVGRLVSQRHRIAARLFARMVDLSDCASRLRHPLPDDLPPLVDATPLGEHSGFARVETARGVLIHSVRLKDDLIDDYAIVAPTEWNFRPGGVFELEGAGWAAPDEAYARWRVKALALALDPCVAFDVSVVAGEALDHA